ncbi:MAG: TIGR00725 family protein [Crenarchaeota archaeon]|nr:TIGR00725 family protein [Thermoproteota archaeon]MCR8455620.1 TIGR00725 family protein [Thermoproteota archaeon]MCR8501446.1 TIGR00725 family protein [Thermoproteota archaeon]
MPRLMTVAIIGDSEATNADELLFAEKLGEELARMGVVVVTGGRGGIMEAVCRGAKKAGGITVGILPGFDKNEANKFVDIVIPTGIGWARNQIVALMADLIIAIGGRSGTLSELAYAWMYNKPIVAVKGFGGWSEKLAGSKIDDRRNDIIHSAARVEDVIEIVEKFKKQMEKLDS